MAFGLGKQTARIAEVMSVVCEGERVTVDDLKSASRKVALVYPRQIAIRLCRELTGHSYPSIGHHFGGRDHTTALHAYRKIVSLEACNPPLAQKLDEYRAKIKALVNARLVALGGCSSEWSPPPPMAHTEMLRPTSIVVTMGMAA